MTWSVSASGHTPTPENMSDWAEVERELFAALADVLSEPRYGAANSHFSGNFANGPVHTKAE